MSVEIPSAPAVLCLWLDPSWVFVDELRRFVEAFCAAACPGEEREEQLALAAHELFQNAVAHSTGPRVELRCEVDRAAGTVRLSVTNAVEPAQAERLRAKVAEVSADADALAGYVAAMRRDPHERGGLGLARIRFEAALELAVECAGERVTVHAVGPLARGEGSARRRGFAAA